MGNLFSPLSVKDAIVERLANCTINAGVAVPQRSYFILDASNSPLGFSASVAQMVYLAEDLVKIMWSREHHYLAYIIYPPTA